ncbi:MAG: ABC transporter permease subunit [Saprospiraceae bacterium]
MTAKPTDYLVPAAVLFPFAFLLLLSCAQQWVFPHLLPAGWSPGAWLNALGGDGDLGGSLLRSFLIALTVASSATGLGFFTARNLSRHPWGERLLRLAYLPYIFAPVILAACLQYYFLRLHLTGTLLGVVLAQFIIVFPYTVILSSGFWNPRMLATEQVALSLGATPAQAARKILLPLAKGPLLVVFFQAFLISWFEYGLTLLIGVGKVRTLPLRVFDFVNEANIFYAAMAACLLSIPPVVLLVVNRKLLFVARE